MKKYLIMDNIDEQKPPFLPMNGEVIMKLKF
jgi:hypothetical protein